MGYDLTFPFSWHSSTYLFFVFLCSPLNLVKSVVKLNYTCSSILTLYNCVPSCWALYSAAIKRSGSLKFKEELKTHLNRSWGLSKLLMLYDPKQNVLKVLSLLDSPTLSQHSSSSKNLLSLEVEVLVAQSCLTLWDPMDRSPPGFSVYGISQARILEWVAIFFSRGSSQLRDRTQASCIEGRLLTIWTTREASLSAKQTKNLLQPMLTLLFPSQALVSLSKSYVFFWGLSLIQTWINLIIWASSKFFFAQPAYLES